MPKLNPNARKWVRALRSGKYKQTKGKLRYGGRFCCLGVACDISRKELQFKWENESFDGEISALPSSVMSWLGLNSVNGAIPSLRSGLASLNDNGKKFATIANLIEKHAVELGVSA